MSIYDPCKLNRALGKHYGKGVVLAPFPQYLDRTLDNPPILTLHLFVQVSRECQRHLFIKFLLSYSY